MNQNKLTIINYNGIDTVESREVAEMVDKDHSKLMRDIRTYIDFMEQSQNPDLDSQNFFIPSTYKGERREEKCYLITKKGCDMVANKITGAKGVVFTALYVSKFEEMSKQLSYKDTLALKVFRGGTEGIIAHKELVKIETKEATAKVRDGNNKITTCTQVVKEINIKGLTTTIFHEFLCLNNYGTMTKTTGERRRCFQPSKKFEDIVAKEGHSYTGKTVKGNKAKVIYSTSLIDHIMDNHYQQLKDYVEITLGLK